MINKHINYLEFRASNLEAIKKFYSSVFGWEFTDYGPNYVSFANSGLDGGFEYSSEPIVNGVLTVLYYDDLEIIKTKVIAAGGTISEDIFSFPGGHRFQFLDPSGNELGVWSDK